MSPEFESLYLRHVITAYEKQLKLADVIGGRSWSFSMDDGVLTFEEEGEQSAGSAPIMFAVQLLGTAADQQGTWLWSWANTASGIPDALTQAARRLQEARSVPEWVVPRFAIDLARADEHRVSMTAAGVLGADAYYRGPYNGGAAFFLLNDKRLHLSDPEGPRIVRTVMEAISNLSIPDHRAAIWAYLTERGLQARADGDRAIVATLNGRELRAEFDAQNRVIDLRGAFGP